MSKLVTSQQLESSGQSPMTLNLRDVEEKARQAVERARAEAKRILTDAVSKAREIERVAAARGEKAGFDAGRVEGIEKGRLEAIDVETARIAEATATIREALMELIGQVEGGRHDVIADAKHSLLDLSVAIADRICRARVCRNDDHLRPMVEEIIEATGRQSGLVLRVSPDDVSAMEAFLGDLFATVTGDATAAVHVVADESVSRGGCIAERTTGRTDAQIETQINRIVAELLGGEAEETTTAGETA